MNWYKNTHLVLFLLIMISAIFIRFNKQISMLDYHTDVARDMLIAKHVVEDRKLTYAKPYSGVTSPYLNNSAVYFNVIALFWFIYPSIIGATSAHTLFSLSIPLIGYSIIKKNSNKWLALATLASFSYSFYFIHTARYIWQPNVLLLPLMIGLYFLNITVKKLKIKDLYLTLFFLFLSLNIHYSALIIMPIIAIWILVLHHKILKINTRKDKIKKWLFLSGFLLCLFLIWLNLVDLDFNLITGLISKRHASQEINFILNFQKQLSKTIGVIFGYKKIYNYTYFIYIIALISQIYSNYQKKSLINFKVIMYTLNFSVLFLAFLNTTLLNYYFGPILIITYLSMPLLINDLIKKKLFKILLLIIFILTTLHSTSTDKSNFGINIYLNNWERNDYSNTLLVSNTIIKDHKKISLNNTLTFDIKMYKLNQRLYWDSAVYYLILEEILEKRLTAISDKGYYNEYITINNNPFFIYIICEKFDIKTDIYETCILPNLSSDMSTYNPKTLTKIKTFDFYPHQGIATTIFRISK
jgi:hypothetical protein